VPITTAHAGRSYPPLAPYELSRAKLEEFTTALQDSNPAYTGERPAIPPTFAAVATFRNWQQLIDDPELGLALRRLIHADQSFELFRPIELEDSFEGWTTLEDVKIRGHLEYLFVRVDVTDQHGQLIGTSRATFIHNRAAADAEEAAKAAKADAADLQPSSQAAESAAPASAGQSKADGAVGSEALS
jgi:hypothetical protein